MHGALSHNEALPHVLLVGHAGNGKTTLAKLIADFLQVEFTPFMMPIKENVLSRVLAGAEKNQVIFLDEIHRMSKQQQEFLLPILEDGYVQMATGHRLPLPVPVTIIGATTEPQKLIGPLYDRFVIKPDFDEYTDDDMAHIVARLGHLLGIDFSDADAQALGHAAAGVPRNVRPFVQMARDLHTTSATEILSACHITPDGLEKSHLKYLQILAHNSSGRAGIDMLANHLQLSKERIVVLERLLVKRGLVEYTDKGRMITGLGMKAIGYEY
jgi:Holliday junction DNA helicase RuvB